MKFHEIDTVGNIWIQRLATKPAWSSADEGRLIFVQADNTMYYGTDTKWTSSFVFKNIAVAGQSTVVALNDDDTLTFVSGTGVTVTTNVGAQSVTVTTKDTEIVHNDTIGAIGTKTHATIDAHIDSVTQHGVTGVIVGTTNSQTLTNKTLTIPIIGDFTNANHAHSSVATGGLISHNSLVDKGTVNNHDAIDAHIASTVQHGATGAIVGTNNSQTLYNKTLVSPVIADFSNTLAVTSTSTGTDLRIAVYDGATRMVKMGHSSAYIDANGYIYANRVYNSVWNDIVDFIEISNDVEIIPGKVYSINDGIASIANKGEGLLGIVSDTYGFAVGKKSSGFSLPIAIGGIVLAFVDNVYTSGTPLTVDRNGNLTKMTWFEKIFYPERLLAIFHKIEKEEKWNDVVVSGRMWVKVK